MEVYAGATPATDVFHGSASFGPAWRHIADRQPSALTWANAKMLKNADENEMKALSASVMQLWGDFAHGKGFKSEVWRQNSCSVLHIGKKAWIESL